MSGAAAIDAAATTRHRDHYAIALAGARRLAPTVGERLRVDALLVALAARGIAADDPRIAFWTAPLICRTPDEQAQYLRLFAEQDPPHPDASAAPPRVATSARPGFWQNLGSWRRRNIVSTAILVVLALMIVAIAWVQISQRVTFPQAPGQCSGEACPKSDATELIRQTVQVPETVSTPIASWWGIGAASVVPLGAAILWQLIRARRRRAKERLNPSARHVGTVDPEQDGIALFAAGRRTFRRLARHRLHPGRMLDVRATIAGTIATGGFPILRYGLAQRTPEYLLLSERVNERDHLHYVARLLHRRMTAQQLAVTHYAFTGTPHWLFRDTGTRLGPGVPLSSLLGGNPQARVLLLTEAEDAAATDAAAPWLAALTDTHEVIHLNPRTPDFWNDAEQRLAAIGIASYDLGSDGLAALGADVPARRVPAVERRDVAADFANRRQQLLAAPPEPGTGADAVIAALDDPLERRWIAALSLYPAVVPRLTVALGEQLRDAVGAPLLTDARLTALARLPWLRAGAIPDWLRLPLARTLDRDDLEIVLEVVQAFVLEQRDGRSGDDPIDIAVGRDDRQRRRLIDWIEGSPESLYADRLLLDLLKKRTGGALGREPGDALPRPLRRAWRHNWVRRCVPPAAALAAILWLVPPTVPFGEQTGKMVSEQQMLPIPAPALSPGPDEATEFGNSIDTMIGNSNDAIIGNETGVDTMVSGQGTDATPPSAIDDILFATGTPPTGRQIGGPWIVWFEWDKSDLTPQAVSVLDQVVARNGDTRGLTAAVRCSVDTDANFPLVYRGKKTRQRCESVRDGLAKLSGGAIASFYLQSFYVDSRAATADGVRDLQNRRAEITLYAPPSPTPSPTPTPTIAPVPVPDRRALEREAEFLGVSQDAGALDDQSDRLYELGNFARARTLNTRSCALGSVRGCFWNGYLYESGKGVPRNLSTALQWYERACAMPSKAGCDARDRVVSAIAAQTPAS